MTVWFTADTHFGHLNLIEYCNRPFINTDEMDEKLIDNWNSLVTPKDTVWHLGDFAFGKGVTVERVAAIYERLHGNKYFIEGNHDALLKRVLLLNDTLDMLSRYEEIKVEGQEIVLFHYGLRTWHHDLRGVWHLYGHSHGGLPPLGKSYDIGVDVWDYAPMSFASLKVFMDAQPIHKAPQFENFQVTS
jgi:calcineurin-like phosphoesterase family protein